MSDFQSEIIHQIDKFCQKTILPSVEQDEHEGLFRKEIFKGLGELGLCGITTSEEFDGASLNYSDLCVVLERLSRYSVSYAVTLSVSSMVQSILEQFGNQEQKKKYLPSLAQGQEIGAFALTESSAGSDAGSLKTSAKKTDGGYILNGSKMFITSGGIAKTYIVMARTGQEGPKGISAFIVDADSKGLLVGKKEQKMGWKVSPTTEINFQNCFVPEENLLASEGEGFKIALSALDRGRITIGAIAVGLSQVAIDEAIKYTIERKQFGQSLFDFQGLQFMIADLTTEIECSRLLVDKAATLYDEKRQDRKVSSMAKMKATDTAMKVTTDAVQLFGGVGYTSEYPVERFMRDAKVLQIVEGSNQIQKIVITRELKRIYS